MDHATTEPTAHVVFLAENISVLARKVFMEVDMLETAMVSLSQFRLLQIL